MAAALQAGQMPQPNTFARSKDDVLNALSFYFGQPVSPEKLKDYNEHHAATCARPSQPAHPRQNFSPPPSNRAHPATIVPVCARRPLCE